MKTSILTVKIDPEVKDEAQKIATELGFSLSAIVTATLKNLIRNKTVSYSLLEPAPLLEKAIRSARVERKEKKERTFSNTKDFMKSLRS